nr:hypothetical protein [uncultured Dongia sp.]
MTTIVFVNIHGKDGLSEVELPEAANHEHLFTVLAKLGVEVDQETFIFIDEEEEPLDRTKPGPLPSIKRGSHIHVSKCRKVQATVHYLEKTKDHTFAPGARVKKVKAWAVDKFKLDQHDAAEHVLQLCGSTDRPPTDTRLNKLTQPGICTVCFDLVPEKRVEG